MNKALSLCLAGALLVPMTGCVYVNGERINRDDWQNEQQINRERIADLTLGESRTVVVSRLGAPVDSEAFELDGEEVRVLFYRTRWTQSDGATSRDETTPVVFRNDRLIGWGDAVYRELRN